MPRGRLGGGRLGSKHLFRGHGRCSGGCFEVFVEIGHQLPQAADEVGVLVGEVFCFGDVGFEVVEAQRQSAGCFDQFAVLHGVFSFFFFQGQLPLSAANGFEPFAFVVIKGFSG